MKFLISVFGGDVNKEKCPSFVFFLIGLGIKFVILQGMRMNS